MKMYVKPSINVIELQLKENIAAVPTTVYKGSAATGGLASTTYAADYVISAKNSGVAQSYVTDLGLSM